MTMTHVVPSLLSSMVLPKSHSLTQALVAPPQPLGAALSDPPDGPGLVEHLSRRLPAAVAGLSPAQRVRIDGYLLRRLGEGPDAVVDDRPFQWSPRNARRALGLGATRALVRRQHRTPVEAVAAEMRRCINDAESGRGPRTSLAHWLATTSVGGRAAVQAEAVTWATNLYGALDWRRFAVPPEIGRDRWWDCPAAPHIGLRGRAEVRTHARMGRVDGGAALFNVLAGVPQPTSRVELALPALVDVLDRPGAPPPVRVVGWWPASGRTTVLAITHSVLLQCADAVIEAVQAVAQGG